MFAKVRTCLALGLLKIAQLCQLKRGVRRGAASVLCKHQHRTFRSESAAVRVLYDGLCPICVTEIRFLQFVQRNRLEKVHFIDISLPDYDGRKYKDVTYEMAMKEMHVIDEKGKVHSGVPAFAVMYSTLGLGWLGRFMMWSPVRPSMDKSYAVFARNHLKWTGRGEECTAGRCEKKIP